MVKGGQANTYEAAGQPVIAIGNDYPSGHLLPPHRHRRAQLLYAEVGTMLVDTDDGGWLVPPYQAVWIPTGVLHSIRMQSHVETRSAYFDAATSRGFPEQCRVVGVSKLLRHLLIEAAELPVEYEAGSRAGKLMALIVEEVRMAPELPLCVPFPRHGTLGEACRAFSGSPSVARTIDDWCQALGLSRRSFTRSFRRETGLSLSEWQRRACLQAALPRLMAGHSVTTVALDLGYASPAAFTAMFTRNFGCSPRAYVRAND